MSATHKLLGRSCPAKRISSIPRRRPLLNKPILYFWTLVLSGSQPNIGFIPGLLNLEPIKISRFWGCSAAWLNACVKRCSSKASISYVALIRIETCPNWSKYLSMKLGLKTKWMSNLVWKRLMLTSRPSEKMSQRSAHFSPLWEDVTTCAHSALFHLSEAEREAETSILFWRKLKCYRQTVSKRWHSWARTSTVTTTLQRLTHRRSIRTRKDSARLSSWGTTQAYDSANCCKYQPKLFQTCVSDSHRPTQKISLTKCCKTSPNTRTFASTFTYQSRAAIHKCCSKWGVTTLDKRTWIWCRGWKAWFRTWPSRQTWYAGFVGRRKSNFRM